MGEWGGRGSGKGGEEMRVCEGEVIDTMCAELECRP